LGAKVRSLILSSKTFVFSLMGLLFLAPLVAQGQATLPPASAFAALPQISEVVVSADGNLMAWRTPNAAGREDIILLDRAAGQRKRIDGGGNKIVSLRFEETGILLLEASATQPSVNSNQRASKNEVYRYLAFNPQTNQLVPLASRGGTLPGARDGLRLVSILPSTAGKIMLRGFDSKKSRGNSEEFAFDQSALDLAAQLYTVDLATGDVTETVNMSADTIDVLANRDGTIVARLEFNAQFKKTELYLRNNAGDWRKAKTWSDSTTPAVGLVGTSGANSVILGSSASEFGEFVTINRETLEERTLIKSEDIELGGAYLDKWTGALAGIGVEGPKPFVQWTDARFRGLQTKLEAKFEGWDVHIASNSRDFGLVTFKVSSADQPGEWMAIEPATDRLIRIGEIYPGLKNVAFGTFEIKSYAARDGTMIPIYVTYPPGAVPGRPLPTVMMPHGGPEARDYPSFDWWAQFMASRGYVVLQPQFRGSTGFGETFAQAGYRQWGRLMQDDVTDAVAWAAKENITDPRKVCIVGGSYGGYAALAGATLTPDVYQCAISFGGVSDLRQMLNYERVRYGGFASSATNYWRDHIGERGDRELDEVSPAKQAARAKAPILLVHGLDDVVVPPAQSQTMKTALERAGKRFKSIELEGVDHWFTNVQGRQRFLEETDVFLRAHLGGQ
jgi:dipeptidyl aminopeptidase/acylaminoacyl peptidase